MNGFDQQLFELLDANDGFKVVVPELAPSGKAWFTSDPIMRSNIIEIYKHVRKKNLFVLVICGGTGEGKSTVGLQVGSDFDKDFTIDNVCMDNPEILKQLGTVDFHSCVTYDEGTLGLNSREAMSVGNRTLLKALQICRDKVRGMIIICIPDFFNLDRSIRCQAVNGLIRVENRTYFYYYPGTSARAIGREGKWTSAKHRFHGTFNEKIPFPEEYEKKKLHGVSKFLKHSIKQGALSTLEVAQQLGISRGAVMNAIHNGVLPYSEGGTTGKTMRYLIKPGDVYKLKLKLKR